MRILGIGAHPDDVAIGCGGTLAKYDDVHTRHISGGRQDKIDQRLELLPLVDIIGWIDNMIKLIEPDVIYTTCASDVNRDHRIINEAVLIATRPPSKVKQIYAFDVTSFWAFGQFGSFKPNVFVDITDTIDKKIEGLKEYKDELRPFPHYRSVRNIKSLAQSWGMVINVPYAEAFELIREIK